jgi:serine/threonine protein kinase
MFQHKKYYGALTVYSSTWLIRLNLMVGGEYRVEVSPEQVGGSSIRALFFLILIGERGKFDPFTIEQRDVFVDTKLSKSSEVGSSLGQQGPTAHSSTSIAESFTGPDKSSSSDHNGMSMTLKYCIQNGAGREVWRAVVHCPHSDIDAVVKLTNLHNDEATQMAQNEARMLASFGNNTGYTPDLIFISTSMIVGWDAYHVIITVYEGEPFCNLEEVSRDQLVDASSALRFLHRRGILHGDIRLANIVVSSAGVVKLIDFGLSHFSSNSDAMKAEMEAILNISETEWN